MGRFAELGAELDTLADAGHVDQVVILDEPRSVSAATWEYAGTIDVWIRDKGTWYGRVRDDVGNLQWVPAADLRKAPGVTNGDRQT